jgi:HEAT repeat protein
MAAWLVPALLLGCGKSGQRGGGGPTASTMRAALSDGEVEQAVAELGDRDKRVAAVSTLGQYKVRKAWERILGHLRDEDPRVRQASAWALGEIGDANDRILQGLGVAVTTDKVASVAAEAARSLGKLHDVKAAFSLVEGGLTHPAAEVQQASADGLAALGTAAAPQVRRALGHQRESVRVHAASALGRMKDAASAEPLLATMRDDHSETVRAAAGEALAAIGPPAVEPLMVALLLRNPPQAFKGEAIDLLRKMGHPAAEPLAVRLAETLEFASPADVAAIIDVLGKIGRRGDPNTTAALEKACKHYSPEVKAAAKAAQEKLK